MSWEEDAADKLSRVREMTQDHQQTWDLSPNDVAALKHVLGRLGMIRDICDAYVLHGGREAERLKEICNIVN